MNSTTTTFEVWGINMDASPQRWTHLQTQVAQCLPGVPMRRLSATKGADLSPEQVQGLVSPQVQQNLSHRLRVCDPLLLNTLGAVGASCSHMRCWEHVAAAPPGRRHWALILEDDCCLDADGMAQAIQALEASDHGAWDLVQLGWHLFPSMATPWRRRQPVSVGGLDLTTLERDSFGAHAYVVTAHGARRLLACAQPLELHVDHFMAVASQVGCVRGYAWPRSVASQCLGSVQSHIKHWDPWNTNAKVMLPDASPSSWLLVLVCLVVATVVVGWILKKGKKKHEE